MRAECARRSRDGGSRSGSCSARWCSCSRARPARRLVAGGACAGGRAARRCGSGRPAISTSRGKSPSSGPYRWLAHPLYVGSSIMGVGLAIASRQRASWRCSSPSIWRRRSRRPSRSEEAFLRRTVRRALRSVSPRRGARASPADARRRFSLAQAMANREHRAVDRSRRRGVAARS